MQSTLLQEKIVNLGLEGRNQDGTFDETFFKYYWISLLIELLAFLTPHGYSQHRIIVN